MRLVATIASALLLAGCAVPAPPPAPPPPEAPPLAGLRFTVEPSVAAAGATVTLLLANGTSRQIGYNLCSSGLEQWTGTAWRAIPADGVCTRELRLVMPGQTARYDKRLPVGLPAGSYRYRTGIDVQSGEPGLGPIYSEPFSVR